MVDSLVRGGSRISRWGVDLQRRHFLVKKLENEIIGSRYLGGGRGTTDL